MAASNQTTTNPVAIIGAGLGGIVLALSLHVQSIRSVIYELRDDDYALGGAIMLSPNALRLLDQLGIYSRLKVKGYNFEWLGMKTDENTLIGQYCFGSESMFGYQALRIYRKVIVKELVAICKESGIRIVNGKKFEQILEETENGVKVKFADGTTIETPLVVGTDGIHSKVRDYVAPEIKPTYMGSMAVAGAVKTTNVRLPDQYSLPVSIFGKPGVFILAPQDVDGSEMLLGTQYTIPEPDRATVKEIGSSPDKMISFLRENYDGWSDLVKSAMEHAIPESMYIWPFYHVPLLKNWQSSAGRVIILGDAAHALSPTLGQGANQAIEDAYTFSLLLKDKPSYGGAELRARLGAWQEERQARLNLLLDMTAKINNNRLPEERKKGLPADAFWKPDLKNPGEEMRWLYDNTSQVDKA